MDRDDIKKILTSPHKPFINLALDLVNLTDKERAIIEYKDLRGHTEKETAEKFDYSIRGIQKIREKCYKKIAISFESEDSKPYIEIIKKHLID